MSGERIGLLHFQTWPDIRIVKFADTLAAAGHPVTVLARDAVSGDDPRAKHPYAAAAASRPSVQVRTVNPPDASRVRRAASTPYPFNPVWLRGIDRMLDEGCRLIIVRDFHLVPAAVRRAHRRGVPVLFDMAENYPALLEAWRSEDPPLTRVVNGVVRNIALARRVERRAVRSADRVIVVVPEHVERVARLGARPPVSVVENTPVLEELLAAGSGDTEPKRDGDLIDVLYTGEIHRGRGLDTVIEAARLLNTGSERFRFTCVGTGVQLEQLRADAFNCGVAETVRFVGWQPDLRPWLASTDIGLVPPHVTDHWNMTMPNKLYDLMAWGKPVVVSDTRPMRRVVEQERCGTVFASGDPASLATALRSLADPATRRELGQRGRSAVQRRYNWAGDSAALLGVVDELLTGSGRSAPAGKIGANR